MSEGNRKEMTVRALYVSAVVTVVIAVVLALVVEPFLIAIALVGVVDLVLARVFASGRLAVPGGPAPEPGEDPSYNPYARED